MSYRIHMLANTNCSNGFPSQMNSLIIETPSGEIVVFDGGWRQEWPHLLEKLRKITGKQKPVVAGWFLTHPHGDHIGCFVEIAEQHFEEIQIQKVYYNFPSVQFIQNHITEGDREDEIRLLMDFYRILPKIAPIVVIVTEGDRYEIGGAVFDVLYSTNPAYTENVVNNTSLVVRATLGTKTVLFLGDLGVGPGDQILKKYGEKLKSDYCQMAHHGQSGVSREVYEKIAPEACIWCTPTWLWNNDIGEGFNTGPFQTVVTRKWMEALGVTKHYVMLEEDSVISWES